MTLQKLSEMLRVLIFFAWRTNKKVQADQPELFQTVMELHDSNWRKRQAFINRKSHHHAQLNHDSWICGWNPFLKVSLALMLLVGPLWEIQIDYLCCINFFLNIQHFSHASPYQRAQDFRKKSVGPTCEASMRKSCWAGDHSEVEDSSFGAGNPIHNIYIWVIVLSTANIL